MGKQLSIYLNEVEVKRLTEIALRECRRPHDQARYFLLNALGLMSDDSAPALTNSKSAAKFEQPNGAFAG